MPSRQNSSRTTSRMRSCGADVERPDRPALGVQRASSLRTGHRCPITGQTDIASLDATLAAHPRRTERAGSNDACGVAGHDGSRHRGDPYPIARRLCRRPLPQRGEHPRHLRLSRDLHARGHGGAAEQVCRSLRGCRPVGRRNGGPPRRQHEQRLRPVLPRLSPADEILAEAYTAGLGPDTLCHALLLHGRPRVQQAGGAERGGHERREDVLRLMERMEPRPGLADRERRPLRSTHPARVLRPAKPAIPGSTRGPPALSPA